MEKVLLEVTYKSNGVLSNVTLEVEEGYTNESLIQDLKQRGIEAETILETEEYTEVEDSMNAGCDNAGFCTGTSCQYYFTVCHGKG